jgi:hypothetical protein
MRLRHKVTAGVLLILVVLLVASASAGCGGSSGTTTTVSAGPTTSSEATTTSSIESTTSSPSTTAAPTTTSAPTSGPAQSTTSSLAQSGPAERQAAEAYFAAMAPVIDKDYQGTKWFEQVLTQWGQTYGSTDLTTNQKAWNALSSIVQEALVKEQEILAGYEAITPPEAFRTAHEALVESNRDGNTWAEGLIAAIKAKRPATELMSMMSAGPPGPTNNQVIAYFKDAAARVGVEVPTKLIDAYPDDSEGGISG